MLTTHRWIAVVWIALAGLSNGLTVSAQDEPFIVDLATGFSPVHDVEEHFFHLRGLDFFIVRDLEHGAELWVSGAEADDGARLLADLRPGSRGSRPRFPGVAFGQLLFIADDDDNSEVLWVTDGTPSGTRRIATVGQFQGSGFAGRAGTRHVHLLSPLGDWQPDLA